jgi:regulator of protease activity HflC (stomatin/prohibitin superfamily)
MNQTSDSLANDAGDRGGKSPLLTVLRQFKTGIVLSILTLLFLVVLFWQTILVFNHAGEQGVYWSRFFGGTSPRVLGEGAHLKLPWDEIYIYDVRLSAIREETMLLTKDGMELDIEWSVRFRPIPEDLPFLHQRIGPDYAQKVVVPGIVSSLRQVLGNYTAEQIYAYDEEALLSAMEALIDKHFLTYPVSIKNLLIVRIKLPDKMAAGIVDKLLYKQQMLAYDFRLKAAELEKSRLIIEAEGVRQFEKISNVSILKWRGIDATVQIAKSPNSKIVVIGTNSQSLPLLLNTDK